MNVMPIEVQCPYCGEMFEIEVESSNDDQDFIQDCTVCCHPIQFNVIPGDDGPEVTASRSD